MDTNEYKLSTHYSSVNKNIHIIALLVVLTHYTSCAMELTTEVKQKPTEYKKRPEEYELFRLERPYGGTRRSAFDIFPTDLFNAHIRGPLADIIATKFKHALLNHKYQETFYRDNPLLKTIPLEQPNYKMFHHDNGKYTLVPDQYNYCMWDESLINRKVFISSIQDIKLANLFQANPKDTFNFEIWIPITQPIDRENVNIASNMVIKITNEESAELQYVIPRAKHFALNHNHEEYAITSESFPKILKIFSLNSRTLTPILQCNDDITSICSAHNSSLFAACTNQTVYLINTDNSEFIRSFDISDEIQNSEFSPNDRWLMIYSNNKSLALVKISELKNLSDTQVSIRNITMKQNIRSAHFTPDGKLIIVALVDGATTYINGITGKERPKHYRDTWRVEDLADIDTQEPLILYSSKNKLIITLDPTQHTDRTVRNLMIRKASGKFNFLAAHNFFPNNPNAMGLTEDEKSIVFLHHDDSASIMHLYDPQDSKHINFIEEKADIHQLCQLLNISKKFKTKQPTRFMNEKATPLITEIRSYIEKSIQ